MEFGQNDFLQRNVHFILEGLSIDHYLSLKNHFGDYLLFCTDLVYEHPAWWWMLSGSLSASFYTWKQWFLLEDWDMINSMMEMKMIITQWAANFIRYAKNKMQCVWNTQDLTTRVYSLNVYHWYLFWNMISSCPV